MTDQKPTERTVESSAAPLTRTSRSRAWLWPTAAVVLILVAVVVLGKLGETPRPSAPSNAAVAVASPTATETLRPVGPGETLAVPRPARPDGAPLVGAPVGLRVGSDRFDDGIPAIVDGQPVLRVRDSAALPIGSVVLVGGWLNESCPSGEGDVACSLILSDLPFVSPHAAVVALGGMIDFERGLGPRVFEATVAFDRACTFTATESCLPRLAITDAKWAGDRQTATSPFQPTDLLGALAATFRKLDFQGFVEASSCPVAWPAQSYVASAPDVPRIDWQGLDVRLALLFPTQDDRLAAEHGLREAAAAMTPFDATNRCVAIPGGVADDGWMVRQNVMILLGPVSPVVRVTVDQVFDKLSAVGSH